MKAQFKSQSQSLVATTLKLTCVALLSAASFSARADQGSMDMSNSDVGAAIANEAAGVAQSLAADANYGRDITQGAMNFGRAPDVNTANISADFATQAAIGAQQAAAQARSGANMAPDNFGAQVSADIAAQAAMSASIAAHDAIGSANDIASGGNGLGCGGACGITSGRDNSGEGGGQ